MIHLHGTATEIGDIAESVSTAKIFGADVPVTALKSYFGHTLGAAGALECWASLNFLREGWLAPIRSLSKIDPRCGELDYVMTSPRALYADYAMINNFAFGGVNSSIVVKKWNN